jgi:RimJ/RimL family protein N-acetyltransferase
MSFDRFESEIEEEMVYGSEDDTPPSFRLRPLRLGDWPAIRRCVLDTRFSFPALTGGLGSARHGLRAVLRSVGYALVCDIANRFGGTLFGDRTHWVMAVLVAERVVGVVMVDRILRQRTEGSILGRFLKRPQALLPLDTGDGELGYFLHPDARGRGLGHEASFALIRQVSAIRTPSGEPVLRRIWAETGVDNGASRRLLERLGLLSAPDLPAAARNRRHDDGRPIEFMHYGRPALPVDEVVPPRTEARRSLMNSRT